MLVLERIECSPFTLIDISSDSFLHSRITTHVDSHTLSVGQTDFFHLGNAFTSLHIRSVTSSTENDGDLGVGIDVVGRDQSTGGIVDQSDKLGLDILS